ncbi:hypothetical protein D3C72_1092490 [compost metagenome]
MIAETQPGVAESDHHPAEDQPECAGLQGEQGAEGHRAEGRTDDLPFVLEAVGELDEQQRPERVGEGDDEGVHQTVSDADALTGQQRRQPVAETEEPNGLEDVEHDQHQRAAAIRWLPDIGEAALAFDVDRYGFGNVQRFAVILRASCFDAIENPVGFLKAAMLREPAR